MKRAPVFYQERAFFKSMWITLTINSLGITYPSGVQMGESKDMYQSHYHYQESRGKRLLYPKMLKNYNVARHFHVAKEWLSKFLAAQYSPDKEADSKLQTIGIDFINLWWCHEICLSNKHCQLIAKQGPRSTHARTYADILDTRTSERYQS